MIYSVDNFKMCREFIILIILINSDVFNNLFSYSKFKGGAHVVEYRSACSVEAYSNSIV